MKERKRPRRPWNVRPKSKLPRSSKPRHVPPKGSNRRGVTCPRQQLSGTLQNPNPRSLQRPKRRPRMMTPPNVDSDDRGQKGKKSPHPQPRNATFLTDLTTACCSSPQEVFSLHVSPMLTVQLQHSCHGETPWTPGRSLRSLHASKSPCDCLAVQSLHGSSPTRRTIP